MTRPRTRRAGTFLALILVIALTPIARGDFITVDLTNSNTLKDGVSYGTVQVEAYDPAGVGLNPGEVRLTFQADPAAYASVVGNFGLHTIGFNTDLSLKSAQIVAPTGWKLTASPNLSEFGKFSWKAATSNSTTPTLSLLITGLGANATTDHFLFSSSSPSGNPALFAAHVKGFTAVGNSATSHWVGGNAVRVDLPPPPGGEGEVPQTPEPASFALAGLGLGGLALVRAFRRKGNAT